jgi:hypothetical protein
MRMPELTGPMDSAYEWHFRVIGYSAQGSVTLTKVTPADDLDALEAAHDEVMSFGDTCQTYTAGPFRTRARS